MINHMVNCSEEQQSRIFQALSDSTRREMLRRIASRNLTVSEIGEPFEISAPAISKHLRVLETAELITRVKDGKMRRFKLNTKPLEDAKSIISELAAYWNSRLDALDEYLKKPNKQKKENE